jgi:ferredoxin
MRVEIDSARCQGHARCMENAPDVFGYDDVTNIAFVLPDADLDAHRAAIMQAAQGCPESAISVTEG